jgi:hypothetical protein
MFPTTKTLFVMKACSAFVSGFALLVLLPAVASANLLSSGNWDFESPNISGAPNAVVTYTVGNSIGDWTVVGSGSVNVHHVNENTIWPGNTSQFLDLTGETGNAGIAWNNIPTIAGQQYEASWSAFNGSLVYSTIGAVTDDVFSFQATGGSVVLYDLVPGTGSTFTYLFTASSSLTTITFQDNTGADSNAGWIDNVQMVLIPEPGVLSLAGLSAVLFAGLFGLRRRSA